MNNNEKIFMEEAFKLAFKALELDEVPIGAILVDSKENIFSLGINNSSINKIDHAEIYAINEAFINGKENQFKNSTLYVTLEPCLMCLSAATICKISRIVYACECENWGSSKILQSGFKIAKSLNNPLCEIYSGEDKDFFIKQQKELLKKFFNEQKKLYEIFNIKNKNIIF